MLSNRILLKWCPAFQDLVGQWKIYNSFITTRFQVFNTLVQTSSAWRWVVTFFLIRELHFLPAKRLQIRHEFCPTFTSLTNLPGFTTEQQKDILFNEKNYQHCVKNTNSRTSGVVKPQPSQRSFQVSRTSSATGEDAIGGSLDRSNDGREGFGTGWFERTGWSSVKEGNQKENRPNFFPI